MRTILISSTLLFYSIASAVPQYSSERQNRTRIELSGSWVRERVPLNHSLSLAERTKKIITKLEKEAGRRHLPDYDDTGWQRHHIPEPENPPPDRYEGGVWYRRRFIIPNEFRDKFIRLQFEGSNYITDVWINGKWVGKHEGGYTPFNFDTTPYINFGNENLIVVRVDNIPWDSRKDIVPYKTCDWWNYGGITRDVFIEICEDISIANVYIKKEKAEVVFFNYRGREARLKIKIKLWDTKITDSNIIDPRPQAIIDKTIMEEELEVIFNSGENVKEASLILPVKKLKRWSPQNPNLYVLQLSMDNGEVFYTQFGTRSIESRSARLFLNNQIIYLNGIARHEIPGQKPEDLYHDLEAIKEMNVNFLRTGHYPNGPELYILTDRLGILVWEEIPVYWFDKEGFNNQLKRGITDQMWTEMIKRDINRPSIIFWGTCNECATQTERREFIKLLYDTAYSIDGTRLVAQSAAGSDPMDKTHEVCDIVGVTMYYGIFYGRDYYIDTLKALEIIHSAFPEKPILITELGTWSGLDQSLAKKQVTVAEKTLKAIFEKPYTAGWTWWCISDWHSFITTFQTMGALTLKKEFKPIYYYLQRVYGNRRSPLTVEILEPYNYATVRGIVEIKTKVESSYKIEEKTLALYPVRDEVSNGANEPEWDTTKIPDGEYIITLKARDTAGVTQQSIKKVFVDNIDDPPKITVNLETGDWLMHTKNIEIQLTDDRTPPMDLTADLFIDGEKKELSNPGPGRFVFNWELAENAVHTLKIKADGTEKIITVTADNSPGIYIKLPYNHDWTSWDKNMSDGTGWDFPAEELPLSNLDFIYNRIKFMFGDKSDGKMNNVECKEQTLDAVPGKYKNLYILASSHDGSASGNLALIYEDNSRETIPIIISDWWGAMPMFGEGLALRCTHHHERNGIDNPPGVGIYLRIIAVNPEKKLKAVILPDEPKMHIFSMTLE